MPHRARRTTAPRASRPRPCARTLAYAPSPSCSARPPSPCWHMRWCMGCSVLGLPDASSLGLPATARPHEQAALAAAGERSERHSGVVAGSVMQWRHMRICATHPRGLVFRLLGVHCGPAHGCGNTRTAGDHEQRLHMRESRSPAAACARTLSAKAAPAFPTARRHRRARACGVRTSFVVEKARLELARGYAAHACPDDRQTHTDEGCARFETGRGRGRATVC